MINMKEAIKCLKCGSYISVNTGYDYIPCACGAIAVDGGSEYVRVVGEKDNWEFIPVKEN